MIKNIIFDIGNVLLTWRPQTVVANLFPEHPNSDDLTQQIFKNQIWYDCNLLLTHIRCLQIT